MLSQPRIEPSTLAEKLHDIPHSYRLTNRYIYYTAIHLGYRLWF